MSETLKQFYKKLQEWIDSGCSDNHPNFCRERAICPLLSFYLINEFEKDQFYVAEENLRLFGLAGLSITYPFGLIAFYKCHEKQDFYQDVNRLAWIKEKSK